MLCDDNSIKLMFEFVQDNESVHGDVEYRERNIQ